MIASLGQMLYLKENDRLPVGLNRHLTIIGRVVNKICLIFLVSSAYDRTSVFEAAFKESGFDVETIRLPFFSLGSLTSEHLGDLKDLLRKKSKDRFLIFSPGTSEIFLDEPDLTLVFSAYKSWYDQTRIRVIPHTWVPAQMPVCVDHLRWTAKPPLRIGFMGTSYTTSTVPKFLLKSPKWIKNWFLKGSYLQNTTLLAFLRRLGISVLYFNTFPRIETIRILTTNEARYPAATLDIVERERFDASDQSIREYHNHLAKNTYIICPRASENYSYRMYETLNYGRIPVIIDTDMVLPKEIDWDCLSIRVPYQSLENIYDFILNDYNSRSNDDFLERQRIAFSTMNELQSMLWVKNLSYEIASTIFGWTG
jgi:hypothetical protein